MTLHGHSRVRMTNFCYLTLCTKLLLFYFSYMAIPASAETISTGYFKLSACRIWLGEFFRWPDSPPNRLINTYKDRNGVTTWLKHSRNCLVSRAVWNSHLENSCKISQVLCYKGSSYTSILLCEVARCLRFIHCLIYAETSCTAALAHLRNWVKCIWFAHRHTGAKLF